jgi:hypothetical protein
VDNGKAKDGRTRGQKFRDSCREKGMVYVAMWVHADDADAVRTYGRRKNGERFRGKTPARRVPTEVSGTR